MRNWNRRKFGMWLFMLQTVAWHDWRVRCVVAFDRNYHSRANWMFASRPSFFWDPDHVFDTVLRVMPLTMPQDGELTIGHEILHLTRSGAPWRYHAEVFDSEAGCVDMGKAMKQPWKHRKSNEQFVIWLTLGMGSGVLNWAMCRLDAMAEDACFVQTLFCSRFCRAQSGSHAPAHSFIVGPWACFFVDDTISILRHQE